MGTDKMRCPESAMLMASLIPIFLLFLSFPTLINISLEGTSGNLSDIAVMTDSGNGLEPAQFSVVDGQEGSWVLLNVSLPNESSRVVVLRDLQKQPVQSSSKDPSFVEVPISGELLPDLSNLVVQIVHTDGSTETITFSLVSSGDGFAVIHLDKVPGEGEQVRFFAGMDHGLPAIQSDNEPVPPDTEPVPPGNEPTAPEITNETTGNQTDGSGGQEPAWDAGNESSDIIPIDDYLNTTGNVTGEGNESSVLIPIDDYLNMTGNSTGNASSEIAQNESNLTGVQPLQPVMLINPQNNSVFSVQNMTFEYGLPEGSNLSTCELVLDDSVNQAGPSDGRFLLDSGSLAEGIHTWSVRCADGDNNSAASEQWQFIKNTTQPGPVWQYLLDGKAAFEADASPVYPGTGDFSVTVWINTSDASDGSIVSSGECCVQSSYWAIEKAWAGDRAVLLIKMNNGSGEIFGYGSRDIADGRPHAITFVRDAAGKSARGYLDGSLELEFSDTTGDVSDVSTTLVVGNGNKYADDWFVGEISDIEVYPRALTDAEIPAGAGG